MHRNGAFSSTCVVPKKGHSARISGARDRRGLDSGPCRTAVRPAPRSVLRICFKSFADPSNAGIPATAAETRSGRDARDGGRWGPGRAARRALPVLLRGRSSRCQPFAELAPGQQRLLALQPGGP